MLQFFSCSRFFLAIDSFMYYEEIWQRWSEDDEVGILKFAAEKFFEEFYVLEINAAAEREQNAVSWSFHVAIGVERKKRSRLELSAPVM